MKTAGLAILLAWAAAAQTVTGTVRNGVTREPLSGVTIAFQKPPAAGQTARTDATGTFRAVLPPGDYAMLVLQPGFELPDLNTLRVHVEDGRDPAPLEIALLPYPKLSGRVLDPERNPVAGISVTVVPFRGSTLSPAITDKQGRFTFHAVSPGEYALLANPLEAGGSEFAPTYFPHTGGRLGAEHVVAKAGADLDGYDIVLRGGPFFKLSGALTDDTGHPASGATVRLETSDATYGSAVADANGAFELDHVPEVDARLHAVWKHGGVELRGFAAVTVTRHDVEGLRVQLAAPLRVTGSIEVDGETISPGAGVYLQLMAVDGSGAHIAGISDESGFRFEDVYPGRYMLVTILGSGGRLYLDSVEQGGRDVTMQPFEAAPGMLPMKIVLRTDGGRVQGTLEDAAAGAVVLIPAEPRLRLVPFVRDATTGGGGRFEFTMVRPGDYYAVALRGLVRRANLEDVDYLAALVPQGTAVHVERKETVMLDLKLRDAPQ